jgi:hypothetical protein
MIKAIILLGTLFINTAPLAVTSAAASDSLEQLNPSRKVATLNSPPQVTDWYSRSSLENRNRVKAVHLQSNDLPPVNDHKRCSDMDTVLNGCKEQPGSIEEAHQRTALAYSRSSGSH